MLRFLILGIVCLLSNLNVYSQVKPDSNFIGNNIDETIIDSVLKPIISFDRESFDLCNIPEDTTLSITFKFRNTGNDTLTIISTKSDCSCTVATIKQANFAPNESGSIAVTFKSKGNAGRFIQYITVLHNGKNGYTFLTLKGFVERQL